MSTADVFGLYPETLVVGSGVTVAIRPIPGQNSAVLKWGSGGSLLIIGTTTFLLGSTFMTSRQYLVGTSEAVNIQSGGIVYLQAVGATCTCFLLRGLTAGFGG